MDHSCDPGLHRLAQALSKDLDLSNVRMSAPVGAPPTNDTAPIFTDGTIITMAGGKLSTVESLAIYGAKIIAAGSLAQSEQIAREVVGSQVHIKYLKGNCLLPGFIRPSAAKTWYAQPLLTARTFRMLVIDMSCLQEMANSQILLKLANQDAGIRWSLSRYPTKRIWKLSSPREVRPR